VEEDRVFLSMRLTIGAGAVGWLILVVSIFIGAFILRDAGKGDPWGLLIYVLLPAVVCGMFCAAPVTMGVFPAVRRRRPDQSIASFLSLIGPAMLVGFVWSALFMGGLSLAFRGIHGRSFSDMLGISIFGCVGAATSGVLTPVYFFLTRQRSREKTISR